MIRRLVAWFLNFINYEDDDDDGRPFEEPRR